MKTSSQPLAWSEFKTRRWCFDWKFRWDARNWQFRRSFHGFSFSTPFLVGIFTRFVPLIVVAAMILGCASIDSPKSAAPATTTLSASAVSSLTAAGTAIGTALGKTPSSSGLEMAGALVPVLYSLAPTTPTPTAALAASIVSAIPAATSKSVPSITLAAANIATALNNASPSTTTAQVAAIGILGNAITTALYPNAQGLRGPHGLRYQPAVRLHPYAVRDPLPTVWFGWASPFGIPAPTVFVSTR